MTGCIFGISHEDVQRKVSLRTHGQRTIANLREHGTILGTAEEILEQCRQLARIGIQEVMLQWLDLDDTHGLEAMADGILDQLSV
jgi:alkanesulfonate monooxygenase SsuD/methylene tetrahydromethanopterin reductase-like flavin-dependent oxidoreductase (luciferase family)